METRIQTLEELHKVAGVVLSELAPRDQATIIALKGDLGAGKTAFVKAVAKHLGVVYEITSPTFVIMKSYEIPAHLIIPEPSILNAVQGANEACDQSVDNYSAGTNERSNAEMRQNRWLWLTHIDAYRIEDEDEMRVLKFGEILNDKENLVCIEWPEKIQNLIPKDAKTIEFTLNQDGTRDITYKKEE
jgi:tRNA threonylcarbamoyladenosine biosynthesis protein TsaE